MAAMRPVPPSAAAAGGWSPELLRASPGRRRVALGRPSVRAVFPCYSRSVGRKKTKAHNVENQESTEYFAEDTPAPKKLRKRCNYSRVIKEKFKELYGELGSRSNRRSVTLNGGRSGASLLSDLCVGIVEYLQRGHGACGEELEDDPASRSKKRRRRRPRASVAQQDDVTVLGPHWCDFVWATAHGLL
uniref:Uncharacterized protein n=1 Tax=Oryza glumipatula TaxID=40148 RepID=A0A0D9ZQP9_9ORYZ